jgi:hypothetical protein
MQPQLFQCLVTGANYFPAAFAEVAFHAASAAAAAAAPVLLLPH